MTASFCFEKNTTYLDTDQNAGKKPSADDKENDNKNENTAGIKQENFPDDEFDSTSSGQPPFKKIRPDCELTANISGKKSFSIRFCFFFFFCSVMMIFNALTPKRNPPTFPIISVICWLFTTKNCFTKHQKNKSVLCDETAHHLELYRFTTIPP